MGGNKKRRYLRAFYSWHYPNMNNNKRDDEKHVQITNHMLHSSYIIRSSHNPQYVSATVRIQTTTSYRQQFRERIGIKLLFALESSHIDFPVGAWHAMRAANCCVNDAIARNVEISQPLTHSLTDLEFEMEILHVVYSRLCNVLLAFTNATVMRTTEHFWIGFYLSFHRPQLKYWSTSHMRITQRIQLFFHQFFNVHSLLDSPWWSE